MHWVNDYFFYTFEQWFYILFSGIAGILFVIVFQFLLFNGIMALKLIKIEHPLFEYSLRSKYAKAIIYLFLAFLISVEVIISWKLGWDNNRGLAYFAPLWIAFIFSATMAIIYALPLRERLIEVRELDKQLNISRG